MYSGNNDVFGRVYYGKKICEKMVLYGQYVVFLDNILRKNV